MAGPSMKIDWKAFRLTRLRDYSLWSVVGMAVLLVAGLIYLHGRYQGFLETPLDLPLDGHILMVEPGDSLTAVLRRLEEDGVTSRDWRWRLLTRRHPVAIQVGEYLLMPQMRPRQLLDLLASGRVVQHRFTIVEGWTWRQLREALRRHPVLRQALEGDIHPAEVDFLAGPLGAAEFKHAEGRFLPETYYFARGASDLDILRRAYAAMQAALKEAWQGRRMGLPLNTPYELLILASIVEKETAREDERRRIAGVFTRRLQAGMRLQTDPTVIYGLADAFDGDIRRRDLDADTAYNTYTRHGLPPTPIALPGKAALAAAADPDDGEAMYFVADGEGGHIFSTTLEEHEAAVQKLIDSP